MRQFNTMHFLVVDDRPAVRKIVITLLKTLGYTEVTEAENGAQALQRLQSDTALDTPINFVITDWLMPVMDGLTLLRTIRATDCLRHLPVLMVTTEAATDKLRAATQAGADGYIFKPFLSASALEESVGRIMMEGTTRQPACMLHETLAASAYRAGWSPAIS